MPLKHKVLHLAAASGALLLSGAALAANRDPKGVWLDDTGRGAIEIKECNGKLCGRLVWAKDPTDAKKGCGLQIIGDVARVGQDTWNNGWIYSPEDDAKYDVELSPLANGTLKVVGYEGIKLFSRTMIWTRAPADLARCDAHKADASEVPAGNADAVASGSAPPADSGSSRATEGRGVETPRAKTPPENEQRSASRDCLLKVPYVTLRFSCDEND